MRHPVIRTHPETGERVVYVNNGFTSHIEGLSKDESHCCSTTSTRQHGTSRIQCRFRWQPGSVAFWDNRVCQHLAVSDYFPARRVMERVTIAGDKPYFQPENRRSLADFAARSRCANPPRDKGETKHERQSGPEI